MKAYGGVHVQINVFLVLALVERETPVPIE
jgi:hypothetical protein